MTSQQDGTASPSKRTKHAQRSKSGCLTCRTRRVKCDESPIECNNCRKLGLVCHWPTKIDIINNTERQTSVLQTSLHAPTSKRPSNAQQIRQNARVHACDSCRHAKTRCSGDLPACLRCTEKNLACFYGGRIDERMMSPSSKGVPELSPAHAQKSHHQVVLPPQMQTRTEYPIYSDGLLSSRAELDRYISTYFATLYPIQAMAFVHRSDLYKDLAEGKALNLLLKAMCGATTRYLDNNSEAHPDGSRQAAMWMHEAKSELMTGVDRFSTSRLATALIIVFHEMASGRNGSSWIYMSVAVRMAIAMGMNREVQSGSELTPTSWYHIETRRRLMWAAYAFDITGSGGIAECTICPKDILQVDFPTSETNYTLKRVPSLSGTGQTIEQNDSLLVLFLQLHMLRSEVLSYTRNVTSLADRPWDESSGFTQLAQRLNAWQDSLPLHRRFSVDNLYTHKGTSELGSLICLHLYSDQVFEMLHRLSLPGFPDSPPTDFLDEAPKTWLDTERELCYSRAVGIGERIKTIHEILPDFTPADPATHSFVFCSIQHQLNYFRVAMPNGLDQSLHSSSQASFALMLTWLGKMVRYYPHYRRIIREDQRSLSQYGFLVYSDLAAPPSGARTPGRGGSVLQSLPYFRKMVNTHIEDESRDEANSREEGLPAGVSSGPLPISAQQVDPSGLPSEGLPDALFEDIFGPLLNNNDGANMGTSDIPLPGFMPGLFELDGWIPQQPWEPHHL